MKIVINIPEDAYKEILQGDYIPDGNLQRNMIEAVRNGTPLPKGHGRLIDADALADGFEDNYEFCEVVNNTPTIIEADKE